MKDVAVGRNVLAWGSSVHPIHSGIVDELKHDCLCPIRQSPMLCPVVAADGHSYDRKAIERWVCAHGTSPMTNMALANVDFVPNILASKFVACLSRAEPSWAHPSEGSPSEDGSSSSEHTPHAWSSEESDRWDAPSEDAQSRADVYHGQAAEVLRALLSHDEAYAPVEAIWNIRNGDFPSDLALADAHLIPATPQVSMMRDTRPPSGLIAFDDT
eukprot:Skav230071  [mRNA]  locus=scaffold2569:73645:74286:+ [translate_table: standard]